MTTDNYIEKIQKECSNLNSLKSFWNKIQEKKDIFDWDSGKAFEFFILRAFELQDSQNTFVKYPYSVRLFNEEVEQIDGIIHFRDINLSILVESKDHSGTIDITPIAKLRSQLLRRPSNAIGAVFTTSKFTEPALILTQFLAPQTILLWERKDIDYCVKNNYFREGMLKKYWKAIEDGDPHYDITKQ